MLVVYVLRGDLIETFKVLKGTNVNPDILFIRSSYCGTKGHSLKLYKREFRTNTKNKRTQPQIIQERIQNKH